MRKILWRETLKALLDCETMVVVVEAWCLKFGFVVGSWEEVEETDGLEKVLEDSRPRRKKKSDI